MQSRVLLPAIFYPVKPLFDQDWRQPVGSLIGRQLHVAKLFAIVELRTNDVQADEVRVIIKRLWLEPFSLALLQIKFPQLRDGGALACRVDSILYFASNPLLLSPGLIPVIVVRLVSMTMRVIVIDIHWCPVNKRTNPIG